MLRIVDYYLQIAGFLLLYVSQDKVRLLEGCEGQLSHKYSCVRTPHHQLPSWWITVLVTYGGLTTYPKTWWPKIANIYLPVSVGQNSEWLSGWF